MTPQARFEAKFSPEALSGCWLWTAATGSTGYGKFGLNGKSVESHRVSYELYVGPVPEGQHVCHRCDVRLCVNPAHLFLGSHADNMHDCMVKGRFAFKKQGDNSRLTEEQVREIRAIKGRLRQGEAKRLAEKYGLSAGGFYKLRRGLRWGHVNGN